MQCDYCYEDFNNERIIVFGLFCLHESCLIEILLYNGIIEIINEDELDNFQVSIPLN